MGSIVQFLDGEGKPIVASGRYVVEAFPAIAE
jgi:hypothetical protein